MTNAMQSGTQNELMEWTFRSSRNDPDPFNDVEFSVVFKDPDGVERTVPAFWSGDNCWRVRFSSPVIGRHTWASRCSNVADTGLHGQTGEFEVGPYTGTNPLLVHGPLQVSQNRRHFEHRDGKPFFWLGDFWTMGLSRHLKWPDDFQLLTADRVEKGFSVILVIAGLYPDMPPLDERGANEAGLPWEKDFSRINPAFFDMMDLRISWLVRSGLVPCIVGCWSFWLLLLGVEGMKKHWRYLVARYGAYPCVWTIAGEVMMEYYLSEDPEHDSIFQRTHWPEVIRYVRQIDPWRHPMTIHPRHGGPPDVRDCAHNVIDDASILDFDMLQTGHSDSASVPNTVERVVEAYAHKPTMPVINGEVCFEGHCGANWQNIQRQMFWFCMLSGAAGHTYGANGVEHANSREHPYGVTPQGTGWCYLTWEEGYRLPGSTQVGLGRKLLERYEWWRMQPHPEWVDPHWNRNEYLFPHAAGIPGELRVIFTGNPECVIRDLELDASYRAFWFDPMSGEETDIGVIRGDDHGDWKSPPMPVYKEWILVLERAEP
ncbi:MAG: hypothetical protein CMJ18_23530 [Phycisphaeraceae bacterium]|nr:hypothetical protein [Phycisphaeraceae bacterium]